MVYLPDVLLNILPTSVIKRISMLERGVQSLKNALRCHLPQQSLPQTSMAVGERVHYKHADGRHGLSTSWLRNLLIPSDSKSVQQPYEVIPHFLYAFFSFHTLIIPAPLA